MRNNKRAISAIVATVLIILITVAAVTIIWAAIIPMIQGNLEGGTVCLDAVSQVKAEDKGYTCYSATPENISLQISVGAADMELSDVQILAYAGGSTVSLSNLSISSLTNTKTVPGSNEEKVYTLVAADFVSGADLSAVDKIEIAPIVATGASSKTCDVSSTITVKACN